MNSGSATWPGTWAERLGALTGWRRWMVAALLGALAATALPPVGLVAALVPAFTGLLWLVAGARVRCALAAGWWFGLGHFSVGFYWVGSAFFVDAQLYGFLAAPAVLGLAAGMAIYPAAALGAAQAAGHRLRLRAWARALVLAALWMVGEWLRGWVFTGFPWNLIGTAWSGIDAMLQPAAWIGAWGLGLVSVAAAALPAQLAEGRRVRDLALAFGGLGLIAVMALAGAWRLQDAQTPDVEGVRLRLIQPNIAQHLKWKPELRTRHVQRQLEMSRQPAAAGAAPTHVIWAETSVPFNLAGDPPLQRVLGGGVPEGGLLIAGAPRADGQPGATRRLWNSAHALNADGEIVATYDKQHLVPFGEYVPFRSILKFSKLTEGRLDFAFGEGPRIIDLPGLPPASVLICYEVIFPDEVPGRDGTGGGRPGWLLNLTNDAWFGVTSGPHQHQAAARLRAVEQGLPLVRAANTGISAVVDAYGRVRGELALATAGVLDSGLPAALAPTAYARFGPLFAWLLALAMITGAALLGRQPRGPSARP
jgi:apolipoprotein N-acyltransferase